MARSPRAYHAQKEVRPVPKSRAVSLNVCPPDTEAGRDALGKLLAQLYADTVLQKIQALSCPAQQKLALLEAVIHTAKKQDP